MEGVDNILLGGSSQHPLEVDVSAVSPTPRQDWIQLAASGNGNPGVGSEDSGGPSRKRRRVDPKFEQRRAGEKELRDFLVEVSGYGPTLPVEATRFHLQNGGVGTMDDNLVRLVALAADMLMATIVHDCSRYRDMRIRGGSAPVLMDESTGEKQTLTKADLMCSLEERGIVTFDSELLVLKAGQEALSADRDANAA